MRASGTNGSWMSGSLDRWLQEIILQPGDSIIAPPAWSTPWSWLRQAADQILVSPVGTRSAVINTIARALQEMGWDADRPKELAAHRLQVMIEDLASHHRLPTPVAKPVRAAVQEVGTGFETGSFSIFNPSESAETSTAKPAGMPVERVLFREEFGEKCLAWDAACVTGLSPEGQGWWDDFLRILESLGGERCTWAMQARLLAEPALMAGFEDLVRFIYPAPVRPGRLSYRCLDRFPPDPRNEADRVVLDVLMAACDECLQTNAPQPVPLVAVRRWQAQSNARLLPSHSPDWWIWLEREGALRAELINNYESKSFPPGVRDSFLAIPAISSQHSLRLKSLALDTGMDPVVADEELRLIVHTIEAAKEQSLRELLSRF
jgi:hypothetical protein